MQAVGLVGSDDTITVWVDGGHETSIGAPCDPGACAADWTFDPARYGSGQHTITVDAGKTMTITAPIVGYDLEITQIVRIARNKRRTMKASMRNASPPSPPASSSCHGVPDYDW